MRLIDARECRLPRQLDGNPPDETRPPVKPREGMHRRPRGILVGRVQGLGGLSWRGLPERFPRASSLRISPRAEPGRILFPAIPEVRVIRVRRGCALRRGRALKLAAGRQSRLKLREFDLISLGACRTYVCVLKSTLQNARYRVFIQI